MKTSVFDYELPPEYIAQEPLPDRSSSRLLLVDRAADKGHSLREKGNSVSFREHRFKDIVSLLNPGDCLVLNNARVLPARLFGRKETGARIEFLFIKEHSPELWEVMVKPARRVKAGTRVLFEDNSYAVIVNKLDKGTWLAKFNTKDVKYFMNRYGVMPTPPYIKKELKNQERYQTVYASKEGAVAAPTAGLHFTEEIIDKLKEKGVKLVYLTLYVGMGTFRPIKAENIEDHIMDEEEYLIPSETADVINKTKEEGGRIIAVGTTVTRTLESAAEKRDGSFFVKPSYGSTSLFIVPGYTFKIIDCLLTNFHLPHSTNIILTSVFGGISLINKAYKYAVENKFRFYSFGDAMLII